MDKDEVEMDVISEAIDSDAFAIVFTSEGRIYMMVPNMEDDAEVPIHVLAGTEVYMKVIDKANIMGCEAMLQRLAEEFDTRTRN